MKTRKGMKTSLKDKVSAFFSVLYGLFVLITIGMYVIYKPVISELAKTNNTKAGNNIYWVIYIMVIIVTSAAVLFIVKIFLKYGKFIYDNKMVSISLIILFTAVPRIIWINLVNVVPVSDFRTFYLVAIQLIEGNVAGNNYVSLFPHVIGYPAVLSVIYRIFGPSIKAAQIFNIILGCGIAIVLYFLGKKLLDERCGFIAAIIWAFWPSQIMYNSIVASEELFTFLFLLCVLFFLYILDTGHIKNYRVQAVFFIVLGILCAAANAIRPFGLLLMTAIAIFYFIFSGRKTLKRKTSQNRGFLKNSALMNSVFKNSAIIKLASYSVLFVSYFLASNFISFLITNTLEQEIARNPIGFNTFVGSNINSRGAWNAEDSKVLIELMEKYGKKPQDIHDELFRMAMDRFKRQSLQNINLLKDKHRVMWTTDNDILVYIRAGLDDKNPSRIDFLWNYRRFNIICNLYYYAMLIFCAIGSFTVLKSVVSKKLMNTRDIREYFIVFLFIIVSGIIAIHMIVEVAGRYHYPAVSLFALISGYCLCLVDPGIGRLWAKITKRGGKAGGKYIAKTSEKLITRRAR